MSDLLRKFDSNLARRRLREIALDIALDGAASPSSIPHTFDTKDLLEFCERFSRRRDVRTHPLHFDFLERFGIASVLCGENGHGEKIFGRGMRLAESGPERSRFLYLIGLYVHFHRGDLRSARDVLFTAVEEAELSRSLKSGVRLALGQTQRKLGEFDAAEREYNHLIEHGVLESRPIAIHYLSQVRIEQEKYDEAEELNRISHGLFTEAKDTFGILSTEATRGDINLVRGRLDLAERILGRVADDHVRVLNMGGAGNTFHNLGVVRRRLERFEDALAAFAQAIKFHAPGNRNGLLSGSFRSVGLCLREIGRGQAALAAFEKATAYAAEVESADRELRSHVSALETILTLRLPRNSVSSLVKRCRELIADRPDDISIATYRELAEVSADLVIRGERGDPRRDYR